MERAFGSAQTGRYAENSVLATGNWVKIQVAESGMHKITYEQLVEMGIKSPENVRIYGYGGAMLPEDFRSTYIDDLPLCPIHMEKGSDNIFSKGDYILFYAQGATSWKYNSTKKIYDRTINPYSLYGYYFVTSSNGPSPEIATAQKLTATSTDTIKSYHGRYIHEIEKTNVLSSGKVFFNEEFNLNNQTHNFSVTIPDIIRNATGKIQVEAAHNSSDSGWLTVKVNNTDIGVVNIGGCTDNLAINNGHAVLPFTQNSSNLNISLTYNSKEKIAYLDYFIIETHQQLSKQPQKPFNFSHTDKIGTVGSFTYCVANATSDTKIWDITNMTDIAAVPADFKNNCLLFVDNVSFYKEYVVFDPKNDEFPTPTVAGAVANQNLHAESQVDMVIISHSEFIGEAQRLAQAHSEIDGLSVITVDAQTVYNEFSSGTPDATAYRRFMKMFYDRASSIDLAPKYLLLMGDGSYDNRQLNKSHTDKNIYRLLTYQTDNSYSDVSSYTTDDYFGFLDDSEGRYLSTSIMDIAVGRIPAYTLDQAKAVVDKTIRYMQNDDLGFWKNQCIFLADDGDNNDHIEGADTTCNVTRKLYPSLLTRKLYFDSYNQEATSTGASYPVLKKEFLDYVNNGVLMINYMGHGGYVGWADETILTVADIKSMYNQRLPLYITATCNFSRFDHMQESAGEMLLTHSNGGAIALMSAARTVIANTNTLLNVEIAKEILGTNPVSGLMNTMGETLMLAKNRRALASDANRMSYMLLGDPAVRLNYPTTHTVIIDTINGYDITEKPDTIGALSPVVVKGYVSDKLDTDNHVDETFNGTAEIRVFDKMQTFKTLCNDVGSTPFTYTYRSNPIFSGKTTVKDGRFEIQFVVPKDIKYNFGTGKIILYASDPEQGLEANGECENIIVGGENSNIEWENQGPDIQIYLNSSKFSDGDAVNENPLFVARVADQSGINTIGTGFGHDIILKLDNDPSKEIVLNNYYQSSMNSYTEGIINYQLNDLTPGKHSIFFRVWDMQNNSSTAEINFEVVKGLAPNLNNLYVYPNPVKDIANIVIENDRPNQPAEIYAYIYNNIGQMVWTNNGNYVTGNDNRIIIQWNTSDSTGILPDGLYLVKIVMIDNNGNKDKKATKLLLDKQ